MPLLNMFRNDCTMLKWFAILEMLLMLCWAPPANAQTGQPVRIAPGGSVLLRAVATDALSYLWFHNGEPINGSHNQRLTVTKAGTYTVMALGSDCNSDLSDPVEIVMDPDPDNGTIVIDMHIKNQPNRPTVLIGSAFTYQLFVINNGNHTAEGVTVTATIPQNVSYESISGEYIGQVAYNANTREVTWLPGDMVPNQSELLTINVRAENEGLASQLATVSARLTDSNPADNQSTASVEIIALKIPNTFTPNGDGINDFFEIRGLELFPENRIVIFNRWGNEVYKANPYKGDWNGNGLNEGTYYYVFEARLQSGRWQTFKGYITLIRNVSR